MDNEQSKIIKVKGKLVDEGLKVAKYYDKLLNPIKNQPDEQLLMAEEIGKELDINGNVEYLQKCTWLTDLKGCLKVAKYYIKQTSKAKDEEWAVKVAEAEQTIIDFVEADFSCVFNDGTCTYKDDCETYRFTDDCLVWRYFKEKHGNNKPHVDKGSTNRISQLLATERKRLLEEIEKHMEHHTVNIGRITRLRHSLNCSEDWWQALRQKEMKDDTRS